MNRYTLIAFFVCVIYGGTYLPIGVLNTLLDGDVMQLLAFRFLLASIAMTAAWKLGVIRLNLKGKRWWRLVGLAAVSPIANFIFETYGLQQYPSSKTGVLTAMIPVVASLMAAVLFKEYPTLRQWGFMAVSVSGVVMLSLKNAESGGTTLGFILIVLCVISASCNNVAARGFRKEFSPQEIAYVTNLATAVFFTVVSLLQHTAAGTVSRWLLPLAEPSVIASLCYLSILSSVVASVLLNTCLAHLPVAVVTSMAAISTVTSVVIGVVLMNETFGPTELGATVLILGGVLGLNLLGAPAKKKEGSKTA